MDLCCLMAWRCPDVLCFLSLHDRCRFENYVDYVMDVPMYFVYRKDRGAWGPFRASPGQ